MSRVRHFQQVALGVVLIVALTGCVPAREQAAHDAAEKLRVAEQMWKADGNTGPLPDISASGVSASIASLARTTERIIMKGTEPSDCDTLGEYWNLIHLAEFVDEQQALLEGVKRGLSQAISGCEDGRWNDAVPELADVLTLANAYAERY